MNSNSKKKTQSRSQGMQKVLNKSTLKRKLSSLWYIALATRDFQYLKSDQVTLNRTTYKNERCKGTSEYNI